MNDNYYYFENYLFFICLIFLFIFILYLIYYLFFYKTSSDLLIDEDGNYNFKFDLQPGSVNIRLRRFCDSEIRTRTNKLIFNDDIQLYSPLIKFTVYYVGENWSYKWYNKEIIKSNKPLVIVFENNDIDGIYSSTKFNFLVED